jgi:2-polyprenyl-6-methoxyphenol hydroxylase and related FAD-dependent oxidoreductases
MNMEPKQISLIGAGLSGALLSIYLARHGYRVTVYEGRPDLRKVAIPPGRSINLALANRGIYALEEVGLIDRVNKLLIPMRGRMLHDEAGHLQFQPYGHKPEEVIYSVSRTALTALLMDAAQATGQVEICFNQSCQTIDFKHHLLTVRNETDQSMREVPFELIIGCDGIHSVVRRSLLQATSGHCSEEQLPHSYKELTIPPGENNTFQIEENALHIWPRGGYMLIALPNLNGGFTVTLFLPNQGEESFASLIDKHTLIAFFNQRFPDVLPLMPHLAEEFFNHPTGRLSTIRTTPWHYRGEGLILGDAAHAIVPFHGQGMNCAFEDCSALNECLTRLGEDWETVFAEFEAKRAPNAEAIADLSLENYIEMRSTVRDPNFQLKKELAWRLEECYPDRFIPRYSMVMFHRTPYAEAKRCGVIQNQILETLLSGIHSLNEVDYTYADHLIKEKLGELGCPAASQK